jgi:hypothetical protein
MLINVGYLLNRLGVAASSEPTRYQDLITYATAAGYSLPTAGQQIVQAQLMSDLETSGLLDRLDVLYIFANDGSKEFATLNWVDPTKHQATLVNSPTFTSNVGFNSDGASAYIDLNINLSTQLTKATLTSGSKFVYKSANSGTAWITGISSNTNDRWQGANNIGWSIHAQQNASAGADSTGAGVHMVSRSSSTNINHKRPAASTNATTTVNTLPNANLLLFRSSSTHSSDTMKLSIFGYGENMEADYTTLKGYLDTYMGSL